jgi:hypothetical protein
MRKYRSFADDLPNGVIDRSPNYPRSSSYEIMWLRIEEYRDLERAMTAARCPSAGERSTDEGDRKAETFASQKSANGCNTFDVGLVEWK